MLIILICSGIIIVLTATVAIITRALFKEHDEEMRERYGKPK